MARYLFSADLILTAQAPTNVQLGANASFTLWSERSGGFKYTDCTAPDGVTALTTDAFGNFLADGSGQRQAMRGPDGVVAMWVDTGSGVRYCITAADLTHDVLIAAIGWLTGGALGATDHGALSGLLDDDHPQYHTDARGDLRYFTQAQVIAAINAAVATASTADRSRSNHSGTQLASSISDFSAAVQAIAGPTSTPDWSVILNKPTTFPPSSHTHQSGEISDATATGRALLLALDAQAARAAIGAGTGNGTSNLALGSTATTAAPGNHSHTASALTFVPNGTVTATDVQTAIQQAASTGGGSGVSAVYIWRFTAGGYPTLPTAKPAGVLKVEAIGPSYPTTIPTWIGLAAAQVPMSYSAVNVA